MPIPGLAPEAVLEEALNEARLLAYIAKAAPTNWRAAAWLLERRHPERWVLRAGPGSHLAGNDPFGEVDELARRRPHRCVRWCQSDRTPRSAPPATACGRSRGLHRQQTNDAQP